MPGASNAHSSEAYEVARVHPQYGVGFPAVECVSATPRTGVATRKRCANATPRRAHHRCIAEGGRAVAASGMGCLSMAREVSTPQVHHHGWKRNHSTRNGVPRHGLGSARRRAHHRCIAWWMSSRIIRNGSPRQYPGAHTQHRNRMGLPHPTAVRGCTRRCAMQHPR